MIRCSLVRAAGVLIAPCVFFAVASGSALAQNAIPKPAAPASAKPAAPAKPAANASGKQGAAKTPANGKAAAAAAGGGQPFRIETFGDWGVYVSDTPKGKVCYALAQPRERLPKSLKRDPGYLFIASRPAENVRNEVSVVLGFLAKDGGDGKASIGTSAFNLVTKGSAAWVKNAAEDTAFVEAMKRGQSMSVEATSRKGNSSTDRYTLTGISQALDRVRKECP